LPFITADASGPKHLQMSLSRSKFEQLIDKYVDRMKKPVVQALADAKLNPKDIDEVVLVGGQTRTPKVQEVVKGIFGKDPHQGVNPDEVVAIGAAIQGAVLTGEVKDVLLLDVTPLSLGIETLGGVMTKLVERNTTIPTEKKETFSTADDNQTAVTIRVFQGEREMAGDNRLLGQFNLEGIPPAPRGLPKIEVSFNIDANGILQVSAKDLGTGKQQSVKIESSAGLKEEDIDRMRKDADSHAEDDKHKRELAEARNRADTMTYEMEKLLKEHGDKLTDSDKQAVQRAMDTVKEKAKGDDAAAIKQALDELQQASHALAQHLYQKTEPQGPTAAQPSGDGSKGTGGKDEGVIDAEFEVKK
jgi:molecular chaperone DnaK